MRVGWLQDNPGYIGGAELTAAEFRAAAPEDVEIIDCPPGQVEPGLDAYVAHNVVQYQLPDLLPLTGKRVVKYCHDVFPTAWEGVREWFRRNAEWVFCSPLQREHMGIDGECVPPAMDLSGYKTPRQSRKRRNGTCSIAQWRNPGKGAHLIEEWARESGPVDVYGPGPFIPQGANILYHGELDRLQMAQALWEHERFVFLPFELEPFCRTVVEAHYAGCEVVTNHLIGAAHYLEENPDALETAAEDFWRLIVREPVSLLDSGRGK